MTTANNTATRLKQNPEIGINCTIAPENLDQAVMLLRVLEGLRVMLKGIPRSTIPTDNLPLLNFIENVDELSQSACLVLSPIDVPQDRQCSSNFYDEVKAILGRQAH